MTTARSQEILYDSEATLRLVERELHLDDVDTETALSAPHAAVREMLGRLREGRAAIGQASGVSEQLALAGALLAEIETELAGLASRMAGADTASSRGPE